jgi:hypothetical protein
MILIFYVNPDFGNVGIARPPTPARSPVVGHEAIAPARHRAARFGGSEHRQLPRSIKAARWGDAGKQTFCAQVLSVWFSGTTPGPGSGSDLGALAGVTPSHGADQGEPRV